MNKHWAEIKEKGSLIGLYIMLKAYKILGARITYYLMLPVIIYYYLILKAQRNASKRYLYYLTSHLKKDPPLAVKKHQKLSTFRHFLSFGESLIDKLAVWSGKIKLSQIDFPNQDLFLEQVKQKKGGLILTAHLGNIEIARALSQLATDAKINALVFNQHALKFNQMLKRINAKFDIDFISVQTIDISLAIKLKDKIDQGEFIVIAADRISVNYMSRAVAALFLGKKAYFPEGAFILAHLLEVETYFMLCLKNNRDQFKIIYEPFAKAIDLSKPNRQANLNYYVQNYSNYLMKYCCDYPYQWFNFYDFWIKLEVEKDHTREKGLKNAND